MERRTFLQITGTASLALANRTFGSQSDIPENANNVTLFLGGDAMTGRGIDHILPNPSVPLSPAGMASMMSKIEQESGPVPRAVDYPYIWGDALEILESERPDFRIVNLETTITNSDEAWPEKDIVYRMNPLNIPVLTAARIDCCTLANNHILDFSNQGLTETLDVLDEVSIAHAGAGKNSVEASAPAILPLPNGGKLRIYAVADHHSGAPREWVASHDRPGVNHVGWLDPLIYKNLEQQISDEKKSGDLALVSIHWGGNWGYEITREQRVFARRMIIAGADVIHGHSSHHVKAFEVFEGRPILYGCGDLINDYEGRAGENAPFRGELTLLYFLDVNPLSGELQGMRMYPMRIKQFRLQNASEEETQWLSETLNREGQSLGSAVKTDNGTISLVAND